jgi:hydrogenase nickel incorporation protein HypA/HybF
MGKPAMHELSLAESMLEMIESAASAQNFSSVRVVWLEIGCMACVEPEALRFCFDAVARDTVAHNARLEIIEIPASASCRECGHVYPCGNLPDACPACGSYQVAVSGASAMRIKELEVI